MTALIAITATGLLLLGLTLATGMPWRSSRPASDPLQARMSKAGVRCWIEANPRHIGVAYVQCRTASDALRAHEVLTGAPGIVRAEILGADARTVEVTTR